MKEFVQKENESLLMEIFNLKMDLSEIYTQKGPASSDYISLSIKLDLLIKEYFEEKFEIWQTTETSQELDEVNIM